MSRLQLAINVTDLDKAVEFYSQLFATAPAKAGIHAASPEHDHILVGTASNVPARLRGQVLRPWHAFTGVTWASPTSMSRPVEHAAA